MSLGTGATKGWYGFRNNTRYSGEVPWQLCEWEPVLQAATNQHYQTNGTSVDKFTNIHVDSITTVKVPPCGHSLLHEIKK